ncbi:hypothetical protein ACTHAM_002706 [Cellulomonas soli]|uniref:hypothetical protein n=1 Tax=Cellulomonas soli TaxID=931535 RepID=UPI001E0BB1B9|nr:hypothetical protein [Cellulomonadaceae bacterium]
MSVPGDHEVPVLEYDETIPPRPEEEVADVARSRPDPAGHGGNPGAAVPGAPVGGVGDTSASEA